MTTERSIAVGQQAIGKAAPKAPLHEVRMVATEVEGKSVEHQVMMLASATGELITPVSGAVAGDSTEITYVSAGAAEGEIETVVKKKDGVTISTATFSYDGSGNLHEIVWS